MSSKEKLIKRFIRQPKDFTWDELVRLFSFFGYILNYKGKTSGSRVMFEKEDESYIIHRPHASNTIKEYSMKQILNYLQEKNLI